MTAYFYRLRHLLIKQTWLKTYFDLSLNSAIISLIAVSFKMTSWIGMRGQNVGPLKWNSIYFGVVTEERQFKGILYPQNDHLYTEKFLLLLKK